MVITVMALASACSSEGPVLESEFSGPAAVVAPSLVPLERALDRARVLEVPVLSPKRFNRALVHFTAAKDSDSIAGDTRALRARAAENELKAALETAEIARKVLAEPLEVRAGLQKRFETDSRKNTPARRAFERAEASFREIAELVEDDQIPRATRERKVLLRAYLECEGFFSPIPSFEVARKNLEKAKVAGADRRFPEAFLATSQTLESARKFAREHPQAYNETPRRIREADFYARRLLSLVRGSASKPTTAE